MKWESGVLACRRQMNVVSLKGAMQLRCHAPRGTLYITGTELRMGLGCLDFQADFHNVKCFSYYVSSSDWFDQERTIHRSSDSLLSSIVPAPRDLGKELWTECLTMASLEFPSRVVKRHLFTPYLRGLNAIIFPLTYI